LANGPSDGGRGLQIESGVGPTQHQLIVQRLKIKVNDWWQVLNNV
jgi:hypothetical protein